MSGRAVRNVAIVLALAAVVAFVPGGSTGAGILGHLLMIVLFGGLLWFAARLYLDHRTDLDLLGEQRRALLYGGIGAATLALMATGRMWDGGGALVALWFALLLGASYALYTVWRGWRDDRAF